MSTQPPLSTQPPPQPPRRHPSLHEVGALAIFVISYPILGAIALQIQSSNPGGLWLPSGFALAFLLLRPPRAWPPVVALILAINAIPMLFTNLDPLIALYLTMLPVAEPLLTAALLVWLAGPQPRLTRLDYATWFIALAVLITSLLTFLPGLVNGASLEGFWPTWWAGDGLGMLVATPLTLSWWSLAHDLRHRRRHLSLSGVTASAAAMATMCILACLIFLTPPPAMPWRVVLPALILPPLIGIATVRPYHDSTAAIAIVAIIATAGTSAGMGPFAIIPPTWSDLSTAQIFLAVSTVTALVLAASAAERAEATATLRAREQTLRSVGRIAAVGGWEIEPDWPSLRWSDEVAAIHDCPPGYQPTPADIDRFYRPEHQDLLRHHVQLQLETHQGFDIEVPIMTAAGRQRWARIQTEPTPHGKPGQRIQGTLQDVTEQREAHAALSRALDDAQAADRAKSQFLANMSHEIRTPLNAVIGMAGLLNDTTLDAEQREYVSTISVSANALLAVINDILDFSKVEAGKLSVEAQPFCLRICLEEALDLVAAQANLRHLDLLADLAPDLPDQVLGDPTRLRQILVNLLANAVKFTERGEVILRVTSDPDGTLLFSVQDTGLGIPLEAQQHLFEAFSQGDSSTTRRYGGTGLGLAISSRLAALLGGSLGMSSAPGAGSTFTLALSLPVVAPAARPVAPAGLAGLAGVHILVVDDSAASRRILNDLLTAWGLTATLAASRAEALGWLAGGGRAEAAIVDQELEGGDGLSVARELRAHPGGAGMALVLLASDYRSLVISGPALCDATVLRPVKPRQLAEALQLALGRPAHSTARAAPAPPPKRAHLRVLVAEDNAVNQQVAIRMLQRLGCTADLVATGRAAVDAVQQRPYDLVLMDVQMPELDGVEATRAIRAFGPTIHQPRVVALTAHALAGDRERYLAAGMDDYLSKPIDGKQLDAALRRVAGTLPTIEIDQIDQLIAGMGLSGRADLADLVTAFAEQSIRLLADLDAAAIGGRLSEMARLAHALKGGSRQVGALLLASRCTRVEELAASGDLQAATAAAAELRPAFSQTLAELRALTT